MSTLIPIPKQVNKFVRFKYYRAITLSSLFDKIMDACIINKQCHLFKFHDILFTYKANHSTIQCMSRIKEIISYYNLNKSPVYYVYVGCVQDI